MGCGLWVHFKPISFYKKKCNILQKTGDFFSRCIDEFYKPTTHNPQPPILKIYVDKNNSCKVINLACICSKNENTQLWVGCEFNLDPQPQPLMPTQHLMLFPSIFLYLLSTFVMLFIAIYFFNSNPNFVIVMPSL